MRKSLAFYAETVETSHYHGTLNVELTTKDPEVILMEFKPQEIIDLYDDLETLYDLLKEKFENE